MKGFKSVTIDASGVKLQFPQNNSDRDGRELPKSTALQPQNQLQKSWALEQPNCKSGLLCSRTTYIFHKYNSRTPQWPHGPYIDVKNLS